MSPSDLAMQTTKSPTRTTRSHSISSDRTSLTGYGGLLSPPASISPEAGFIAASAASQIVTNDYDSRSDTWFDQHGIEPSGETALVAPLALKLVNRFLDQLLFNFLSVSKSTSLASLRPAVGEVLKTKLAKEAIHGADQELHEYLGGGEDEELMAFHNGIEPSGNWDLELVWKRTRLRCMVYSSLGDMEEEDEDYYTEQEQLDGPPGSSNRFSNNPGVVSPAVAIFLTSILEYMGEQVLVVAGQSAHHRLRAKHEKEEREGSSAHGDIAERVVVEESDMERVALDRTLGRLWRGWKKRIRSPNASVSLPRSFSRESMTSQPQTSVAGSIAAEDAIDEEARRPSLAAVLAEFEHAASIPLPLSPDDIREIEIPGLAPQSDDEGEELDNEDEDIRQLSRPKSMEIFRYQDPLLITKTSQLHGPIFLATKLRKRSLSLPSPAPSPYSSKRQKPSLDTGDEKDASEILLEGRESQETEADVDAVDATSETGSEFEKDAIESSNVEPEHHKGPIAGVVSGAAALGTAAVIELVAAANGQAPQAEPVDKEELDTDEEITEEPQIMTSSRVSIGGRISPDNINIPSRRSSVRSHSVHSLRLIDVASPKSPSRSGHGSADAADYATGRPVNLSRSSSIHSPIPEQTPPVASPISRGPNASPIARNGSSLSTKQLKTSAEDSILEEKEISLGESTPLTAVPTDIAGATQGDGVSMSPMSQEQPLQKSRQKPTSNPATFVLAAPPTSRHIREVTNQPSNDHGPQQSISLAPSKTVGVENGVPPLTPLREMMEGAPDTSDEASSIAPSNYSRTASEHGVYGHSPSVSASTLPQSQRDHQRSTRSQHTTVTRTTPPRSSPPREDALRRTMAEPLAKPPRSTHTSGSTSSNTSHKLKPVRTSEDSAPNAVEDKGQSFEQLIRSDQTIQYTLTPQNMRNIEAPDSPRHVTPIVISTGHDARRPGTSRSHSSSVSKSVAIHSSSPAEQPKSPKLTKPFKPTPRTASNTGTRVRPNAPQARDARVDRDSIGDFAEFIRSTGPANEYDSAPPRSVQSHRGTNGTSRNASGSAPRVTEAANLPRRAESSAGRSRLQARDAVVPRGDSISDLIDFVRSGPQLEKDNHRIPRTVAPFRTTMDSDQMSGAVGGKAIDASLPDPRYSQATSVNSSVNSQSALLNTSSKAKPSPAHSQEFDEQDMMPKRKTRRVRDPYAIDFSDEEDEYEAISRPKPIQEESLADFLRNVPPPPESTTTPVFETARPTSTNIKKKSSTPSFRSRFSRKDSATQLPPKPKSNGNDSRSSASRTGAPQLPTHTPIAAKYSTTSLSYQPPRGGGNYVSQLDSARNKVVQKSYQPREAVYSNTRTNDLADFLMRSEPPSAMQTQPQTFTPTLQKEEGAFQRMFGRKKIH